MKRIGCIAVLFLLSTVLAAQTASWTATDGVLGRPGKDLPPARSIATGSLARTCE